NRRSASLCGVDRPLAYLQLHFSPSSFLVTVVRRFVTEFYAQVLGNADATSRMALATHELLENGVKYSSDGRTELEIRVVPGTGEQLVEIRAHNQAIEENVAILTSAIDEINRASDVVAFYRDLMQRSARRREG